MQERSFARLQNALPLLTTVDVEGWLSEIPKIREFYARFGQKLPTDLMTELDNLEARLSGSQSQ